MPPHTPYTGRLAPSPTGLLHIGHARTFWLAAERARLAGGTLLLRDDDLDAARVRPHFAAAMREDLRWLGLHWTAEFRQSDRLPLYRAAMQQLLAAGLAYPCTCSRKDLAQSAAAPHEETDDEPVYNNRCRPLVIETCHPERSEGPASPAAAHLQPNTNYRFVIPSTTPITFDDASAGPQSFTPGRDFGDFILWRKDDTPSYQFACTVDDALLRITEVVRGRDLLKSTARQVLLQRALGYPTPAYCHVPLVRDEAGIRLAKRHDALSLRALREAGRTPADILATFCHGENALRS